MDPCSKLLVLQKQTQTLDSAGRFMFKLIYIPHDTLLSYVATSPTDTDTVIVPWVEWGPGNTHTISVPMSADRYFSSRVVCGMRTITGARVISGRDNEALRIMGFHPRRIARILATQDLHLPGTLNTITREGYGPFDTTGEQRSHIPTSPHAGLPYATMDIPFPDGRQPKNIEYVLGEDVVVLLEVGYLPLKTRLNEAYTVSLSLNFDDALRDLPRRRAA
ncbi:hypothetical protein BJV78DRAFT_1241490 [Lactifluus subvellereus]|nr:hypothetical protein BJV78DRAFT_1241490 [Lactifluus subvellereus]